MQHLRIATRLVFGIVALGGVETAWADVVYSFTTLDVPGASPGSTSANGINNSGQIVGTSSLGPFLYTGGTFTTIAGTTNALGINDSGQIVTGGGVLNADGSFTPINFPGAEVTSSLGINNSGQVVGDIFIGTPFGNQGFLYSDGNFTFINVPFNIRVSSVYGISSNNGQIVGTYNDFAAPHALHGFLDNDGSFTMIDVPFAGAGNTHPLGANDSGQIVGWFGDASGIHGFLDTDGSFTTIDVPGASSTQAHGINDSGQIVGRYTDINNVQHGFLATPQRPAQCKLFGST
jgi:probable HAF family extracellular repeat protein